jgi:hypothetical protein
LQGLRENMVLALALGSIHVMDTVAMEMLDLQKPNGFQ